MFEFGELIIGSVPHVQVAAGSDLDWAATAAYGIRRKDGETDDEFRSRMLSRMHGPQVVVDLSSRRPPPNHDHVSLAYSLWANANIAEIGRAAESPDRIIETRRRGWERLTTNDRQPWLARASALLDLAKEVT